MWCPWTNSLLMICYNSLKILLREKNNYAEICIRIVKQYFATFRKMKKLWKHCKIRWFYKYLCKILFNVRPIKNFEEIKELKNIKRKNKHVKTKSKSINKLILNCLKNQIQTYLKLTILWRSQLLIYTKLSQK